MVTETSPGPKAEDATIRRTFVLVHGAWHGGWCWRRVADGLRAMGHAVFTPTLSGLAEHSHTITADIDLDTHIADVVNLVAWEGLDDIVLVGHSYAGWVISGVAEHLEKSIRSICFVDAFFPENGESGLDEAPEHLRRSVLDEIAAGATSRNPPSASAFDVNERDRAWVDAKLTPMPLRTFASTATLTGARDRIPMRSYVRCTCHPAAQFDRAYERVNGRPGWRTYELPSGHCAMIDMPERLIAILQDIA